MKPFFFRIVWRRRATAILLFPAFVFNPARADDLAGASRDTSRVPGVVIDHIPQREGRYVGSPSIAILPDGRYVASHDEFGPKSGQRTVARTRVFCSADRGATWSETAVLDGMFWGNLFVHEGVLYLMGVTREYGRLNIRRSTDGGRTWTAPTGPDDGYLTPDEGYHSAPMPLIVHGGRLWRAYEDNRGGAKWGECFRSFVLCAPTNADLLKASSWRFSPPIPRNPDWIPGGKFRGWLEGGLVVDPSGAIVNLLRVDTPTVPEKAAIVRVTTEGGKPVASFDPADLIDFPGGAKKFTIRFDPDSKLYWTLSTVAVPPYDGGVPGSSRTTVWLMSSPDLRAWTRRDVLLHHPDRPKHGFQYIDWLFDGADLVAACRTAHDDGLGGAHNNHDANFLTFHRVADFRNRSGPAGRVALVAETGRDRVLRFRIQPDGSWIPDGVFASGECGGAPLDNPFGLAADGKGVVFVGEQKPNGRILCFGADGGFRKVLATESRESSLRGNPEALCMGPDGFLYVTTAFGELSDTVARIHPANGEPPLSLPPQGPGFQLNDPRGLAFDPEGRLHIADRGNKMVRRTDLKTFELAWPPIEANRPQGLHWDAVSKRLLLSAGQPPALFAVSPDGGKTKLAGPWEGEVGALGIASDRTGIFLSHYTAGTVERVTPTGTVVVATQLEKPGHLLILP